MDYHIRYKGEKGHIPVVRVGDGGLKLISFDLLLFDEGMEYCEDTGGSEACIVILGGSATVSCGGKTWENIGRRRDVFDGPAAAVYAPRDSRFEFRASSGPVEAAVLRTLTHKTFEPAYIPPDMVNIVHRGKDNWSRTVHDILDHRTPAGNMLAGETFSPPGNWSSAPPHRHDVEDPPNETDHEEIYLFKVKPEQGFQLIRLYTDDYSLNTAYCVEQNDTVIITQGYHPVAAGPGYQGYYLWLLAGRSRTICPRDDPRHAWLKNT